VKVLDLMSIFQLGKEEKKVQRQVCIQLEENEAEFIAGELHRLDMNMNEERREKRIHIGNKIAEQLLRQRHKSKKGYRYPRS